MGIIDPKTFKPEILEKIKKLPGKEQAQLTAKFGREDLFFFVENILGYSGLSKSFHGEITEFLKDTKHKRKLLLAPRGHLKTTLAAIGYVMWRIVRNPDIRIMLASATESISVSILREIKNQFETNQMFRSLYANIIPPDFSKTIWTQTEIVVNRETRKREPTILAVGVGGNVVSLHFDLIIKDDVVNDDNSSTVEQAKKVIDWHAATSPLFDNPATGEEVILGTRWAYYDLYENLLTSGSAYHPMVLTVWASPDKSQTVWPEKFPVKSMVDERERAIKTRGLAFFIAQYENKIIDEATQIFSYEVSRDDKFWFDEVPKIAARSMTIDPAISEKQGADATAITIRAVDDKDVWYVEHAERHFGMRPEALIERIFQLSKLYKLDAVAIETISFQRAIRFSLESEMNRRGIFLPLVDMPSDTRISKELRIKGIASRFNTFGIKFRRNAKDDTVDLLDELYKFPKAIHDDLADSLAMHQHLKLYAHAPAEDKTPKTKTDRYGYPIQEHPVGRYL